MEDMGKHGRPSADHTPMRNPNTPSSPPGRVGVRSICLSAPHHIGRAGTKCFLAALDRFLLRRVYILCRINSIDVVFPVNSILAAAAAAEDEDGKLLRRLLLGQQVKLSP